MILQFGGSLILVYGLIVGSEWCILYFISYFLEKEDGVGAARSLYLLKLLQQKNVSLTIISRYSFGKYVRHKLLWLICCIFKLLGKTKQVIYMSCGPFWYLLVVAGISYILHHRLIVDFRDPWSLNIKTGYGSGKCHNLFQLWVAERIECMIYFVCYQFIVCTPGMKTEYRKVFGDDSKISVVLNGHEVSCDNLLEVRKNNKRLSTGIYQVICIGKFADYTANAKLIVENLIYKLEQLKKTYVINFVGTDEKTEHMFLNHKKIKMSPRMPYSKLLPIISEADLGLCVIRNENYDFGTKIFDYIALGIPIYDCFGPSSIFRDYFAPYIVSDLEHAKRYTPDYKGNYSREKQLYKLVEIIKKALCY